MNLSISSILPIVSSFFSSYSIEIHILAGIVFFVSILLQTALFTNLILNEMQDNAGSIFENVSFRIIFNITGWILLTSLIISRGFYDCFPLVPLLNTNLLVAFLVKIGIAVTFSVVAVYLIYIGIAIIGVAVTFLIALPFFYIIDIFEKKSLQKEK